MCGVVQGGDRAGFALEPLLQVGIGRDMLGQHLDGDGAVQAGVGGLVDLAHAPCAEGGLDLVRAECGAGLEGHLDGPRLSRQPGQPPSRQPRLPPFTATAPSKRGAGCGS